MRFTDGQTPMDTDPKLKVHKTFSRRSSRLLNVLCTFNIRPVSRGCVFTKINDCNIGANSSVFWLYIICFKSIKKNKHFVKYTCLEHHFSPL